MHEPRTGDKKRSPDEPGFRAEDGIRTRDLLLGKEVLYQLSHFRIFVFSTGGSSPPLHLIV